MVALDWQFNQDVYYCYDSTLLGTFTENQDQPRLASFKIDGKQLDNAILSNALTFNMLSDGIPIVYYGAEQEFTGIQDPENREPFWFTKYDTTVPLYQLLKKINLARNALFNQTTFDQWSPYWVYKSKTLYLADDAMIMRKGYEKSIVAVMTNRGLGAADIGPYPVSDSNFLAGDTIVDVLSCNYTHAGATGDFNVTITGGQPQV